MGDRLQRIAAARQLTANQRNRGARNRINRNVIGNTMNAAGGASGSGH